MGTREAGYITHVESGVLRTEGSARFDAVLDLKRPTRVRIEATGPLAQLQSASTVTEIWTLLPGKDYSEGNGIILRLPGMVVDVLAPPAHLKTDATNSVEVSKLSKSWQTIIPKQ
jgi:hypothetical protein